MVIILVGYILVLWLVFFRFRLLRFNWTWGIAAFVLGAFILALFLALLNTLTPSGRATILGRVVEVIPDVPGRVIAIPVQAGSWVKAGDVLFEIERAPFSYRVNQLRAALAEAQQRVERMKADVAASEAEGNAITAQIGPARQRRDDLQRLASANATSQFQLQDANKQVDILTAQLEAANARAQSLRLGLESSIEGEHTSVVQIAAQLDQAQWELDSTTVRAPSNGYVVALSLSLGQRVLALRAAMSYVVADESVIFGIFPQNGFAQVKPGAAVKLSLANAPGRVFDTTIIDTVQAVGEGQVAVSGTLARISEIRMTGEFVARIARPRDIDPDRLRLGMAGTATVISPAAGPIGVLATILQWIQAYLMYL